MMTGREWRFWAAPVLVLAVLGLLAGCGSGGGNSSSPTASPSVVPTASPTVSADVPTPGTTPYAPRVTARVTTTTVGGATVPAVDVQWEVPSFTPAADVVEYHIYRDDTIIGVAPRQVLQFTDTPAASASSITYFLISSSDDTKLTSQTASALPLSVGVPAVYRVTALYVTAETASSATPIYAERLINQSDAVTP